MTSMSLILAVGDTYRSVVIALMLAEANVLVDKLNLPEERPIRVEHLRLAFVAPQDFNRAGEVRGTIETERFLYAFARSNKLTSLGQLYLPLSARFTDEERDAEARRRAIPASQVDTNAAWEAMLPYLKSGIFDMERLQRECDFHLRPGRWGSLHVPIYTAEWTEKAPTAGAAGSDRTAIPLPVVQLTIVLPEKLLHALRVDPRFSARPELEHPTRGEKATPKREEVIPP